MQDIVAKTPNKRKSLANGTPKGSGKKQKAFTPNEKTETGVKTKTPKSNRKQAADFFNTSASPGAMNGINGKNILQTEKKAEKNKENKKRKSLPAKLFENESPKKAKIEGNEKLPMFEGTASLGTPNKKKKGQNTPNKQENVNLEETKTPKNKKKKMNTPNKQENVNTPNKQENVNTPNKQENVNLEETKTPKNKKKKINTPNKQENVNTPNEQENVKVKTSKHKKKEVNTPTKQENEETAVKTPKNKKNKVEKAVSPAKSNDNTPTKNSKDTTENTGENSGEKRVHKRQKKKKTKVQKLISKVPKEIDGVKLNKRQQERRKSKLKASFNQAKIEKWVDLVGKGVKKATDVVTNIKEKIAELESRPKQTKTAERRLRSLKKVLRIVQDPEAIKMVQENISNKPSSPQNKKQANLAKKVDIGENAGKTKTQIRKERKLKNIVKEQKDENEFWANELKKSQSNEQQKTKKNKNKDTENVKKETKHVENVNIEGNKNKQNKETNIVENVKTGKKKNKQAKNDDNVKTVENKQNKETKLVKLHKQTADKQQVFNKNVKDQPKKLNITAKMEKNMQEADDSSSSEESDYEVEKVIKPDKVTKTMNEFEKDTDEEDSDEMDVDNSGFVDEDAQSGEEEEESEDEETMENEEDDDDEMEEQELDENEDEEESDSEIEVNLNKGKPEMQQKGQNKVNKKENKKQQPQKGKQEGEKNQGKPQKGKQEGEQNQGKKGKFAEVPVKELQSSGIVQKGQSRYVVFVGNLPYDAQKDEIKGHFAKAGDVLHIRIPTEKGSQRPRGFCYVELKDEETYQRALSLHHSFLKNRRINVLYTQGGKKKPEGRKKEIKEKNFKLSAMRNKGMLAGSTKENQKRSVRRAKKRNFEKKRQET